MGLGLSKWRLGGLKFSRRRKGQTFFSSAFLKKVKSFSRVRLFATPWTVAYQVPLSMGFSKQEYWSGLPFPSPGDLPNSIVGRRFTI